MAKFCLPVAALALTLLGGGVASAQSTRRARPAAPQADAPWRRLALLRVVGSVADVRGDGLAGEAAWSLDIHAGMRLLVPTATAGRYWSFGADVGVSTGPRAGEVPTLWLGGLGVGYGTVWVMALWSPRFMEQYSGQFRYGERPAGVRTTEGLRWTGPPRWVNDGNLDDVIEWAAERTTPDTVLAHGQPWPFAFFTGRPLVLLPYRLNDAALRRFLIEYRVSYVLHDPRDSQRREYGDQLRDLESSGVRGQRLKNLVIYDTRALWQP